MNKLYCTISFLKSHLLKKIEGSETYQKLSSIGVEAWKSFKFFENYYGYLLEYCSNASLVYVDEV